MGVMPLHMTRYAVAISWDRMKRAIDIDLQAVIVDHSGTIIDAVYYNRLETKDGALIHSGDEKTGTAYGFDEVIWVNLSKITRNVALIIFVVAAHHGDCLSNTGNTTVHILDKHMQSIENFKLDPFFGSVVTCMTLDKGDTGDWNLGKTQDIGEDGNHFMDILEPTIGDLIRRRIQHAPKQQKASFPMAKGCTSDLPKSANLVLNQPKRARGGLNPKSVRVIQSIDTHNTLCLLGKKYEEMCGNLKERRYNLEENSNAYAAKAANIYVPQIISL